MFIVQILSIKVSTILGIPFSQILLLITNELEYFQKLNQFRQFTESASSFQRVNNNY